MAKQKDIECKFWAFLAIIFSAIIIVTANHGWILRLMFEKEVKLSKGIWKIDKPYIFVPKYKLESDGFYYCGAIYHDYSALGICMVYDIEKSGFKNNKTGQDNYEYLKKRWLKSGYVLTQKKIGGLDVDEWYFPYKKGGGFISIAVPEYEVFMIFYTSGEIDNLLKSSVFEKFKSTPQGE